MSDQTTDGRRLKFLCVVDEFTREFLALAVRRSFRAQDVIAVLAGLIAQRGGAHAGAELPAARDQSGGAFEGRAGTAAPDVQSGRPEATDAAPLEAVAHASPPPGRLKLLRPRTNPSAYHGLPAKTGDR